MKTSSTTLAVRQDTATVPRSMARRVPALDFTKGVLVLIMVLYHWLNYFIGTQHEVYRYLRFLTPSFIFITGFLISSIYFKKYEIADGRLPMRLLQRGLKIVGVFTLLNVILALTSATRLEQLSIGNLVTIYLIGPVVANAKAASFYVLVPIGYLLILSAWLVILRRFYKYVFQFVFGIFLVGILSLYLYGLESQNLELITTGLLGVICGYVSLDTIDRWVARRRMLVVAYGCYAVTITVWNVRYPLQVIGVCLSLMVIYLMGSKPRAPGRIHREIILVGQYSLFAYIAQIAVLRLLRSGLPMAQLGAIEMALSFAAGMCLTILAVEAVHRARARAGIVNSVYATVFS
jgi:peptidoglycan/LPS O-acetylase OafA/YrhL